MALPASPPPVSPRPPGSRRGDIASSVVFGVLAVVMVLDVLACAALGTYVGYVSTHNVPNPWWATFNKSFRYNPEHGPPSSVFFVVRPEVVARQYVADYIGVAGTFPCAGDLASIADQDQFYEFTVDDDPVVHVTGPCTVHRPVARVDTPSVYVGKLFSYEVGLGALVDVIVTYTDGERWSGQIDLDPQQYEEYYGLFGRVFDAAAIHETCWQSSLWDWFYPLAVARVPAGVGYMTEPPAFQLVCQT